MIYHNHNCVFVHINKTAGTSIAHALGHPKARKQNHQCVPVYINSLGDRYKDFFSFSFVRNPWDKMLSLYYAEKEAFPNLYSPSTTLNEYLESLERTHQSRGIPAKFRSNQVSWLLDTDENIAVDFIGRFENLQADWGYVCKKINANLILGHHLEGQNRPADYRSTYTDYSYNWVTAAFSDDIKTFNYKF